ncbi:hypothetical protein DFH06DRAFT_1374040 [Mycena polygramma]|nr:hypothetical protein DFH06DRAFT_1374040 [Mycena polygramma]
MLIWRDLMANRCHVSCFRPPSSSPRPSQPSPFSSSRLAKLPETWVPASCRLLQACPAPRKDRYLSPQDDLACTQDFRKISAGAVLSVGSLNTLLNHAPQPCSSPTLLNRAPQPPQVTAKLPPNPYCDVAPNIPFVTYVRALGAMVFHAVPSIPL